jgi:dCMP deaminase
VTNRKKDIMRTKLYHRVYMKIAIEISNLSRCNRAKVGALIVNNKNIISYGYNGTPSGFCNDCEENNITKDEVIHAETNAILKAGKNAYDSTLYLTLSPCLECCKLIKQSGIKKVYYLNEYRDLNGLEKLKIDYERLYL